MKSYKSFYALMLILFFMITLTLSSPALKPKKFEKNENKYNSSINVTLKIQE